MVGQISFSVEIVITPIRDRLLVGMKRLSITVVTYLPQKARNSIGKSYLVSRLGKRMIESDLKRVFI